MKHTYRILLLLCLLAFAGTAAAQTSIYIGAGPSLQSDLPRGAMNVTVGLCNHTGGTCALVNYAARGTIDDFKQNTMVYTTSAGVRQVIATAQSGQSSVDLFLLGNAGAALAATATGFSGAAGGGLTFHPGRAPNWSLSFAAQSEYSPVNPGWRPNLFIQAGYTFGR